MIVLIEWDDINFSETKHEEESTICHILLSLFRMFPHSRDKQLKNGMFYSVL